MTIKLSQVSKLDNIASWSLEAGTTCPASHDANGQLVDACKGCYAKQGNYRFSNVKKPRLFNQLDWVRDDWVDDMVKTLDSSRYFRWFDSGDMYSIKLAEKIYQVMQRTPWVKHWIPTRMQKFAKFQDVISRMEALPNVKVRFSSDSVSGEFTSGVHGSVIVPTDENLPSGVSLCEAYRNDGKCNGCRKCWDKDIPVIAYVAHGRAMQKVISLKVVN